MKRVTTTRSKTAVNASITLQKSKIAYLKSALQTAYDTLESMDDDTYNAVDGEAMLEDLHVYIQECAAAHSFNEPNR